MRPRSIDRRPLAFALVFAAMWVLAPAPGCCPQGDVCGGTGGNTIGVGGATASSPTGTGSCVGEGASCGSDGECCGGHCCTDMGYALYGQCSQNCGTGCNCPPPFSFLECVCEGQFAWSSGGSCPVEGQACGPSLDGGMGGDAGGSDGGAAPVCRCQLTTVSAPCEGPTCP